MCYDPANNKRVPLTVEKHPELVTDWYKQNSSYGQHDFSLTIAKILNVVTPPVIEWLDDTGFDAQFRAFRQSHVYIIFDDEMECKLFRLAFGC